MKRVLKCLALIAVSLCLAAPGASWATVYDLPATADATVDNVEPDFNYGAQNQLPIIAFFLGNIYNRAFLKFDLSITAGETITGANLYLYCTSPGGRNADLFYVANDSWGEDTITWNNQPDPGALLSGVTPSPEGWIMWDLMPNWTPDIDGFVSLLLKASAEDTGGFGARFLSDEYNPDPTLRPYLRVTTNPVPIPGAVWLLGSGLLSLVGIRRFRKG
jgi:hypothetical protein